MAENVMGGLGSMVEQAEAPVAAPPAAPAAPASGIDDYLTKVKKQQEESFAALDARRKKLLELSGSRKQQMFDPQMLALSSALLRPTKTGSFGESLGYATEALGAEQEKQLQREQADAKMQMELEQATQEQKRKMLSQQMMMQMMGGSPSIEGGVAPVMDAGQAAPPQVATAKPAAAQKTGLDQYSDQQLMAFAQADPENSARIDKFIENRRKQEELKIKQSELDVKESSIEKYLPGVGDIKAPKSFWDGLDAATKTGDLAKVEKYLNDNNFSLNTVDLPSGGKRVMSKEEIALAQEAQKAKLTEEPKRYTLPEIGIGTFELLPSEYRERNAAKAEGKDALQAWWNKTHPEFNVRILGAKRPAAGEGTPEEGGVESTESREVRVAKEKKVAEQRATSEVKGRDEIIANAKAADRLTIPAQAIYNLAKDPIRGKALGLLEDPTVGDAFMGVVAQGAQVGSYNVGIPAIRDAVAKLSGGNKEEANKIMSSLQMLAKNFSIIELNLTRMYLQGEGAVTEGERNIVRNISGGVGTRRDVAMSQAEMFLQRADFDMKVKQEMLRWEKANPNKSFDDFGESSAYKNLWSNFNKNMDKVYNKYFGDRSNAAPASSGEGRQLPANSSVNIPVYGRDSSGNPVRIK